MTDSTHSPSRLNRSIFFILVGVLLVCLLGALGALTLAIPRSRNVSSTPPVVKTLAPDSLYLGTFRTVQGTQYLVAEVNEEYKSRGSYSSARWFSYSDSDSGGHTHNLVFLEGDSLASRRLFNTNDYVITAVSQFPEPNLNQEQIQAMIQTGETGAGEIITVRCLVFQFVVKDTNQDGKLNSDDLQTVGITDAGGHGFAELFTSVERVYWMEMTGPNNLVLVYSQGGTRKASMIDTTSRTVIQTQPMIELGPEVR